VQYKLDTTVMAQLLQSLAQAHTVTWLHSQ
jgi:hypothetical protein